MTVTLDTEDGAYEIEFHRLDEKGGTMDYAILMEAVRRVFGDLDQRITRTTEAVTRGASRQRGHEGDGGDGIDELRFFGDEPRLT